MTRATDATRARGGRSLLRAERGAVGVEAALILPIFLILILGIMEWSLVMRDQVAVGSAVRTGVRTASIPPAPDATGFTQATADAIQRAGSAMPKDNIQYILVYQANAKGFPLPEGNETMTCAGAGNTCVRHEWNDARDKFGRTTGTWDVALVNTCVGDPDAQAVGVYMKARHPMVTGLFGSAFDIEDKAVLRFEPRPKAICRN